MNYATTGAPGQGPIAPGAPDSAVLSPPPGADDPPEPEKIITETEARERLDDEAVDRALGFRRHYETDGGIFWIEETFREIVGLPAVAGGVGP